MPILTMPILTIPILTKAELLPRVLELAAELARAPPLALARIKQVVVNSKWQLVISKWQFVISK